jgi:hypothetical protein
LAVNPDVQAKVREEVDSVLKKHDGQLSFDAIQEMTYMDMALSGKIILACFKSCFQIIKPRNIKNMDFRVHFI